MAIKFRSTPFNLIQRHSTGVVKAVQHVENNVEQCWMEMLNPFDPGHYSPFMVNTKNTAGYARYFHSSVIKPNQSNHSGQSCKKGVKDTMNPIRNKVHVTCCKCGETKLANSNTDRRLVSRVVEVTG